MNRSRENFKTVDFQLENVNLTDFGQNKIFCNYWTVNSCTKSEKSNVTILEKTALLMDGQTEKAEFIHETLWHSNRFKESFISLKIWIK